MPLRVNAELVPDQLIEQEEARMREHPGAEDLDRDRLRRWAEETIIERVVIRQAAIHADEAIPPEVVERCVREYRSKNGICSEEPGFSAEMEVQLRIGRLIERAAAQIPEPSEEELRQYFEEHRQEMLSPEVFHASHVVKHSSNEFEAVESLHTLEAAQALLRKGVSFEDVVRKYSDCPANGGDLGAFPPGEMLVEFESELLKLEAGQISPIFRTPAGFHIAKLHSHTQAQECGFGEARTRIIESLLPRLRERAIEAWIDQLLDGAVIERL